MKGLYSEYRLGPFPLRCFPLIPIVRHRLCPSCPYVSPLYLRLGALAFDACPLVEEAVVVGCLVICILFILLYAYAGYGEWAPGL